jgi:hypothetical protein
MKRIMRSLLLQMLERLGRIRLPAFRFKSELVVGRPNTPDHKGAFDWRNYLDARALSAVWGPRPTGPWLPFHCITLFAAVDYLDPHRMGPCLNDPWPIGAHVPPSWIDPSALLLVDLPGPVSAALGADLGANGCDLVCTFNNWPHPDGVIRPQETLAALLRYAAWLSEKRTFPAAPAPAAWLCDAERLGSDRGKPGQFDNRYYIEDAILPGPRYLKERGISRVYYICAAVDRFQADIVAYLLMLEKENILVRQVVATRQAGLSEPMPCNIPATNFSSLGFFRSSAGGFGAPVPHPSSGG